jgi:hypothetical protein
MNFRTFRFQKLFFQNLICSAKGMVWNKHVTVSLVNDFKSSMGINPEIEQFSGYNNQLMKANIKLMTEFVIAR